MFQPEILRYYHNGWAIINGPDRLRGHIQNTIWKEGLLVLNLDNVATYVPQKGWRRIHGFAFEVKATVIVGKIIEHDRYRIHNGSMIIVLCKADDRDDEYIRIRGLPWLQTKK